MTDSARGPGPSFSEDRRWFWTGTDWVPAIQAPPPPLPAGPPAVTSGQLRLPDSATMPAEPLDGQWRGDEAQWLLAQRSPTEDPARTSPRPASSAYTDLIAQGGRWFTAEKIASWNGRRWVFERLWWDHNQWLPYRPITWTSIQLHSNPPEDRAALSRNLGLWCACFGILGLISFKVGALSIMAAAGGGTALFYGVSFFQGLNFLRLSDQAGTRLPGRRKAVAALFLSLVGLTTYALAISAWTTSR